MRIFFLVPRKVFDTKMSRERFAYVEAIAELPEWSVHWSGPGWSDWNSALSAAANVAEIAKMQVPWPNLVLEYMVEGLAGCAVPVATSFNEAWDYPKVEAHVRDNGIGLAIFHYETDLPLYRHWMDYGISVAHIPHCADPCLFRDDYDGDSAASRDIDVLVVGNLNDYYYPFRYRLMKLATRVLRKRGYRVVELGHPGYVLPARAGTLIGEPYARMLARSKLVFTCSSRFRYALTKYAEIGLAGAVAVTDCPGEREETFKQTCLVVEPWMLDDEILRTVEETLDAGTWKVIGERARSFTLQTTTTTHYARRFQQLVTDFLARLRQTP